MAAKLSGNIKILIPLKAFTKHPRTSSYFNEELILILTKHLPESCKGELQLSSFKTFRNETTNPLSEDILSECFTNHLTNISVYLLVQEATESFGKNHIFGFHICCHRYTVSDLYNITHILYPTQHESLLFVMPEISEL